MTQCPHCHAVLPEPPDRFCPSCGTDLAALGVTAPPPPPPPPGYPPRAGYDTPPGGQTPWERRGQIGLFNALVETTKQVLGQPAAFFRAMPVTGGVGAPLGYGVIVGYAGLFASVVYRAIFQGIVGTSLARMGGGSGEFERIAPYLQSGAGLVIGLVFGPVFIAVALFVTSAIIHLVLLAMSGAARGFEATFRVCAYSEAAALFNIVPFCGGLIGGVYTIVLLIIGISEAHGISRGKAAAAVLLPLALICCCCAAAAAIAAFGVAGMLGRMNR